MKKLLSILFVVALAVPAFAQFRGVAPYTRDVLGGTPLTINAGSISNITVMAYVGRDGFAVTPYMVAASASTANVYVFATPDADGKLATVSPSLVGAGVALNGTTPVRGSAFAANSLFYGTGYVQLSVTNASAVSVTVSNLTVSAW